MFKRAGIPQDVLDLVNGAKAPRMRIPGKLDKMVKPDNTAVNHLARTMGAETTIGAYFSAKATFARIAPMPTYKAYRDEALGSALMVAMGL